MAIRFGDRAERDLTDLRAAAHHDDALAVDFDQRRRFFDADDAVHCSEIAEHSFERGTLGKCEFEVRIGQRSPAVHVDIGDVCLMIREDAGHAEQHARTIGDGDEHGVSGHTREDTENADC